MSSHTLQIMVGGRVPFDSGGVGEVVLSELLGSGGFASVWRVQEADCGRPYALKIVQGIKPGSVMAERVRLEAEVSIPSEHVVKIIGLREWDSSTFLILFEYFEGRSLDLLLEKESLGQNRRRRIFEQTLRGVADAHKHNVIHRDLKPANILVDAEDRVKLIDFGISKFKGAGLTISGEIIGTMPYMAPELILHGAGGADARTDIYALGHILYELAMGQHFWGRKGWKELKDLVEFLTQDPPPTELIDLSDFRCDFFDTATSVLLRMVKNRPEERYASVEEVSLDLGYSALLPATAVDITIRSPVLIVESGTNRGARTVFGLGDGEGREMGRADIAGNDESISRRHLQFSRRGNQYFVRDVGSRNGTMVRGLLLEPGTPPTEIRHSDRIKVGDVYLRFVFLFSPFEGELR